MTSHQSCSRSPASGKWKNTTTRRSSGTRSSRDEPADVPHQEADVELPGLQPAADPLGAPVADGRHDRAQRLARGGQLVRRRPAGRLPPHHPELLQRAQPRRQQRRRHPGQPAAQLVEVGAPAQQLADDQRASIAHPAPRPRGPPCRTARSPAWRRSFSRPVRRQVQNLDYAPAPGARTIRTVRRPPCPDREEPGHEHADDHRRDVRPRRLQDHHPRAVAGCRRALAPLGRPDRGLARARPPRPCSTWRGSPPGAACSTWPPGPASSRSGPPAGSDRPARCSRPTSHRRCSSGPPPTPAQPGWTSVRTLEVDGEGLDRLDAAAYDAVISRVGLIYFPDQQRALAGMRHALRDGGRVVGGRLLDARAQRVLLAAGRDHPAPCPAAAAAARPARPLLPRRPGRPGRHPRGSRLRRRRGGGRRVAGAAAVGRGVRALRAGVVRRAAPDDARPSEAEREETWAEIEESLARVRGTGRVRRALRDARGRRHPLTPGHPGIAGAPGSLAALESRVRRR